MKKVKKYRKHVQLRKDKKTSTSEENIPKEVIQVLKSNNDQDNFNKEQRRGNRLAALIGMIAIMLAFCNFFYKEYLVIVNVWPSRGLIYGYMHVLMTILFSSVVVIIIYAFLCCVIDLLRFNVIESDFQKYDKHSDIIFSILIKGTKCSLIILALVAGSIYFVLYVDNPSWVYIFFEIIILLIMVMCIVVYLVPMVRKNKRILFQYLLFLLPCIIIGLFIYADGLLKVAGKTDRVSYSFEKSGIINVYEEGVEADILLSICNEENKTVYTKKILYGEFMKSYQKVDISSDNNGILKGKSMGTKLNSEIVEGFAQLNINNIIKDNKCYSLNLSVYNDNKKSIVYNNFKYNGVFIYAKNNIKVDF